MGKPLNRLHLRDGNARLGSNLFDAAQEVVETPREGRRIARHLSVENIGLIKQQIRQILHILCSSVFLRFCQMSDQSVFHVEFEDGFGADAAVPASKQTLQLLISTLRTCYQAACTLGKTRRRLRICNPVAQRAFHSLQTEASSPASALSLSAFSVSSSGINPIP